MVDIDDVFNDFKRMFDSMTPKEQKAYLKKMGFQTDTPIMEVSKNDCVTVRRRRGLMRVSTEEKAPITSKKVIVGLRKAKS